MSEERTLVIQKAESVKVIEVNRGPQGEKGEKGEPGQDALNGLPAGGTDNQVLAKKSSTDYDVEWKDSDGSSTAAEVSFDDTETKLTADNVQDAIEILDESSHTHSNKSILDQTTASFIMAEKVKLLTVEYGAKGDQSATQVPISPPIDGLSALDVHTGLSELQSSHDSMIDDISDNVGEIQNNKDDILTNTSGLVTVNNRLDSVDSTLGVHSSQITALQNDVGTNTVRVDGLSIIAAAHENRITTNENKLGTIESGAKDDQNALEVPFSPIGNLIVSTDVQNAISETNTRITFLAAEHIGFDDSNSGLVADETQQAIDKIANSLVVAGNGLEGGGDRSADVTLSVKEGKGITSDASGTSVNVAGGDDGLKFSGNQLKVDILGMTHVESADNLDAVMIETTSGLKHILVSDFLAAQSVQRLRGDAFMDDPATNLTEIKVSDPDQPQFTIYQGVAPYAHSGDSNVNGYTYIINTAVTIGVDTDITGTTTKVFNNDQFIWIDGTGWTTASTSSDVVTVFGRTGEVVAEAGDIRGNIVGVTPVDTLVGDDVQESLEDLAVRVNTNKTDLDFAKLQYTDRDVEETINSEWTHASDIVFTSGNGVVFNGNQNWVAFSSVGANSFFIENILTSGPEVEIQQSGLDYTTAKMFVGGHEVLTENSTVDADTLDGLDSLDFAKIASDETITGEYEFTQGVTVDGISINQSPNKGVSNLAIGEGVLVNTTSGNGNIAVGGYAQTRLTEGFGNISMGYATLWQNTIGNGNTAIGAYSQAQAVNSNNNTSFGYGAFPSVLTGDNNTILGAFAAQGMTTSGENTIVGANAMGLSSTSIQSTAFGVNAFLINESDGGVAIGYSAGSTETAPNKLHIANKGSESLIEGDFDSRELTVHGDLTTEGLITDSLVMTGDLDVGVTRISASGPIYVNRGSTGNRNSTIQFNSDDVNPFFSSSIQRGAGVNGEYEFTNQGTGKISFYPDTTQTLSIGKNEVDILGTLDITGETKLAKTIVTSNGDIQVGVDHVSDNDTSIGLYSTTSPIVSSEIKRSAGTNGALDISNIGTGDITVTIDGSVISTFSTDSIKSSGQILWGGGDHALFTNDGSAFDTGIRFGSTWDGSLDIATGVGRPYQIVCDNENDNGFFRFQMADSPATFPGDIINYESLLSIGGLNGEVVVHGDLSVIGDGGYYSDLFVLGDAYATRFFGDGSNLTGIVAGIAYEKSTVDRALVSHDGVVFDVSSESLTATLPVGNAGDLLSIGIYTTAEFDLVITGADNIMGSSEDFILSGDYQVLTFAYIDVAVGWKIVNAVGEEEGEGGVIRHDADLFLSSGVTTFPFIYDIGFLDVFVNGFKLPKTDFIASNGTSVSFVNPLTVDSNVNVVAYNHGRIVDVPTASQVSIDNSSNTLLSSDVKSTVDEIDAKLVLLDRLLVEHSMPNLFVNGGLSQIRALQGQFWTFNAFFADHWFLPALPAGKMFIQMDQNSTDGRFLELSMTSTSQDVIMSNKIEDIDFELSRQLTANGNQLSISFEAWANTTSHTGTVKAQWFNITTQTYHNSTTPVQFNVDSDKTRKEITFTVPALISPNAIQDYALEINFKLLEGSMPSGVYNFARFKAEVGEDSSPYAEDDPVLNLKRCQRYYQKYTALSLHSFNASAVRVDDFIVSTMFPVAPGLRKGPPIFEMSHPTHLDIKGNGTNSTAVNHTIVAPSAHELWIGVELLSTDNLFVDNQSYTVTNTSPVFFYSIESEL